MSDELIQPGSPDGDLKLAAAIADSVEFVAGKNRSKGQGLSILEAKDPARASAILAAVCRGVPERTIIREIGTSFDTVRALKRRHHEIVTATRVHRSLKATQIQLKAADALEKKLEDVLDDDELRAKTSVKDLALGYGIATDKQRVIQGESAVHVTHEHKVSLDDARKAIEDARAEVSSKEEERVIDV